MYAKILRAHLSPIKLANYTYKRAVANCLNRSRRKD